MATENNSPRRLPTIGWMVLTLVIGAVTVSPSAIAQERAVVTVAPGLVEQPLDGRVLVMLSKNADREPRFQVAAGVRAQLVLAKEEREAVVGAEAVIDSSTFGYPVRSLAEIPAGEYWVQGLLHRYETFHRSDGHVVKLPMDRGEGQRWNRAPGNLYSEPRQLRFDPAVSGTMATARRGSDTGITVSDIT